MVDPPPPLEKQDFFRPGQTPSSLSLLLFSEAVPAPLARIALLFCKRCPLYTVSLDLGLFLPVRATRRDSLLPLLPPDVRQSFGVRGVGQALACRFAVCRNSRNHPSSFLLIPDIQDVANFPRPVFTQIILSCRLFPFLLVRTSFNFLEGLLLSSGDRRFPAPVPHFRDFVSSPMVRPPPPAC